MDGGRPRHGDEEDPRLTEVNVEQRKRWGATEGNHWVDWADRFDRMLAPYSEAVIRAASPEPGEAALDVGCGNGALSLDLAARVGPTGSVTGVDLSPPMLSLARRRAGERSLGNVRFIEEDAQIGDLGEEQFDLITSRFGVMFFDDPVAAFTNLRRAAKPDARLVFACWQPVMHNQWFAIASETLMQFAPPPPPAAPGTPGPFAFSEPEFTRGVLEEAGWADVELTGFETSQWLGSNVQEVVEFLQPTEVAKSFLVDADDETVTKAWEAVAEKLEPHVTDDGVLLKGRVWLVSASH